MATATISSMLLSSDRPDRLRDWYAYVFDATVEQVGDPGGPGYDVVDLDGFALMIDSRPDVTGPSVDGARVILNAEVDDARATAARIDELDGRWVSALEERTAGWFATALDPDGNHVQLVQLSAEMIQESEEATTTPYCGIAVHDVDAAQVFYRDVLGFRVEKNAMGMLTLHLDRRNRVLLYSRPDHRPAEHTVLNIPVDDIDAAVDRLVARGVRFLRYDDLPADDRAVIRGRSVDRGPDIAWFTDPSGNVVSVLH